jgi:hypothetical protein
MSSSFDLRVICGAGYRGEETPQRFYIGERAVEVVEVLDRWIAPDHRYFKCLASDEDIYILRHDIVRQSWELTLFERASRGKAGVESETGLADTGGGRRRPRPN